MANTVSVTIQGSMRPKIKRQHYFLGGLLQVSSYFVQGRQKSILQSCAWQIVLLPKLVQVLC